MEVREECVNISEGIKLVDIREESSLSERGYYERMFGESVCTLSVRGYKRWMCTCMLRGYNVWMLGKSVHYFVGDIIDLC